MELRNFPMDRQSCPLILGSCRFHWFSWNFLLLSHFPIFKMLTQTKSSFTNGRATIRWILSLEWRWGSRIIASIVINIVNDLIFFSWFLSQFDLISFRQQNLTFARREGDFSTLQVSFNLQRHTGYFLIQVLDEGLIINNALIHFLSGLCAVHSHCHLIVGFLLDSSRGH